MRTLRIALLALAIPLGSLVSASGCYGSTEVVATSSAPRLVWISDGVWVVEDWPHSVYYHDSYYWRSIDGVWYRSSWHDSGWVRFGVPPLIVRVHRPRVYVRYRAPRGARVRVINRKARPKARDNRARPKVRDNRTPPKRDKNKRPKSRRKR